MSHLQRLLVLIGVSAIVAAAVLSFSSRSTPITQRGSQSTRERETSEAPHEFDELLMKSAVSEGAHVGELNDFSRRLAQLLGDDSAGKLLHDYVMAPLSGDSQEEILARSERLFRKLDVSTLLKGLERIPAKTLPEARISLLYALESMHQAEREIRTILEQEVLSDVGARPSAMRAKSEEELDQALSTTTLMTLPVVAHEMLLDHVQTESEALNLTRKAIKAQSDPWVKQYIELQLLKKFPRLEREFKDKHA